MDLPKLNFNETYDFEIKRDKDKFFIYDVVRKSWFLLTPEEWVRQHWVHYFHITKGRNLSSLILEKKLILNGTTKRIDLLVTEKTVSKILVECKAPHIKLTEKTFEQTARYNSVLQTEEIILSNGLQHIFAKFIGGKYEFYKGEF
ncbi:type I restriction enzyme HsdR N-terminal domain-containing protein [Chryseobacterium sp. SNU WT5]|uniref:type I restriction enzyme HsdR N-terminal domain-containing protein n=1 Tax=Chryseobacterium sp. SNU WT5 TaxID=2594269 RepID=UPI00117DF809|nr:type I restriction enzyme HsdR N-terminal domain-containing protein [Chryseobacterium sp. SNU WT5]QDP86427.1 type I restriction enzyme HsdR N-terminal domain-containing protein [Chryseobacterium sp. SNU WT5]